MYGVSPFFGLLLSWQEISAGFVATFLQPQRHFYTWHLSENDSFSHNIKRVQWFGVWLCSSAICSHARLNSLVIQAHLWPSGLDLWVRWCVPGPFSSSFGSFTHSLFLLSTQSRSRKWSSVNWSLSLKKKRRKKWYKTTGLISTGALSVHHNLIDSSNDNMDKQKTAPCFSSEMNVINIGLCFYSESAFAEQPGLKTKMIISQQGLHHRTMFTFFNRIQPKMTLSSTYIYTLNI